MTHGKEMVVASAVQPHNMPVQIERETEKEDNKLESESLGRIFQSRAACAFSMHLKLLNELTFQI